MKKDGINSDSKDFGSIYEQYFPRMVRFAREYVMSLQDAENIAQNIFLSLLEKGETFEAISNVGAYLFTLTKNRCLDFHRKKSRENGRIISIDDPQNEEIRLKVEALQQFRDEIFTEQNIDEILETAINHLPEKCREAFLLSRREGLSHKEIADKLNISPNTVQNHISKAIHKLNVELRDYLPALYFFL
ncbi:MAG: RNA polymerase sigma-70 factor [Tannerella sp.]|jgi:RNA polymerase sigma-70 factor (ECF subfamily)|nr:RNA polymerase sigma-70 factor [Tannerella sp.]